MRSCFGGVVIYSNVSNIIQSQCNYDVIWSKYDARKSVKQSVIDKQYKQLTLFANKMRDWRPRKKSKVRRYKKRDNHICEHIPFHYCLFYKYNYSTAIAKYAYLFYEPVKMYKLDFNERLIEQTPSPTSETARQRRKRERKAQRERQRQQRLQNNQNNQHNQNNNNDNKIKQIIVAAQSDSDKHNDHHSETNSTQNKKSKFKLWWILIFVLIVSVFCVLAGFVLLKVIERCY